MITKTKQKVKENIRNIREKLSEFVPIMDELTRARNPFELRYFVIGKHDDRIQQYKQAVIEMDAKYQAFLEGMHDMEMKELEKEEKRIDLILSPKDRTDEIHNDKINLEIKKIERDQRNLKIGLTGAFKEVMDFISIIENEFSDLMDKTEEELLNSEADYWKSRFSKQIMVDLVTGGRIGGGNLSTLLSMPKDIQEEIMLAAGKRTEEFKQFDVETTKKLQLEMTKSVPHKTSFVTPPDYKPLKFLKDAPNDYPPEKIVPMDRAEIMIASLHRPEDWHKPKECTSISTEFYIPAGKNYIVHCLSCPSGDQIGEYRNRLILSALSLGCTHIFFVDDDIKADNGALQKLYAHNKDIIGGWYPKKTPVIESATLISDGESKQGVPLNSVGLIDIDWSLTAGLTLIKTEVFRKIPYPWFVTTTRGTEDTYFTARAKEVGYKLWLDTDIKAIHADKGNKKEYKFSLIN